MQYDNLIILLLCMGMPILLAYCICRFLSISRQGDDALFILDGERNFPTTVCRSPKAALRLAAKLNRKYGVMAHHIDGYDTCIVHHDWKASVEACLEKWKTLRPDLWEQAKAECGGKK